MTRRRTGLALLGETEMEILNIVWGRGRASVSEVRAAIQEHRPIAHNTVQTIMRKLGHKGYLAVEMTGKTHYYTPKRPAAEVKRGLLQSVIGSVFAGSRSELVRTLVSQDQLSDEEIESIEAMLRDRRRASEEGHD